MRITSLLASVCMSFALLADGPPTPPAVPGAAPATPAAPNPFVWDAMSKELAPKAGENTVTFTFWVTNTGPTEARIDAVSTSCGCTVAQLPSTPWIFKPGDSGPLSATMNLTGKFGLVQKIVNVNTSAGQQQLLVRANIPTQATPTMLSGREKNQLLSLGDRQAVFKGDCAKCHVEPAAGRTGEKLFIAACGICHVSDHRAAMVPNLAELKTATSADYWRTWITYGKPGSLMPAFAKEQGGILDQKQIDSLVDYLVKHFPSAAGAAPASLPQKPAQALPPLPPAIPQSK